MHDDSTDTNAEADAYDEVREIGDVTVEYKENLYKGVPADYEPTAEEQAAVDAGDLQIGYGADEVTEQNYQFLRWEQDGVAYTLTGFDLGMTADELFDMAAKIIQA